MSKKCDKCSKEMSGWGTTCGECRKTKGASGGGGGGTASDKCAGCGKVAYAMERICVEGTTFHPTCFKCIECGNKLNIGAFSKSPEGQYYCKTHYAAAFQRRGRYSVTKPDAEEDDRADRTTQAVEAGNAEQERRVAADAAAEEAAKAEQQKAEEDAKKAADEEQERRVAETAAADEAAKAEQLKNEEEAKKAQDEEQARRVSEIEEIDQKAEEERKNSQEWADTAMDTEQKEQVAEAEASPEKKRSSFTPDLAELASKVAAEVPDPTESQAAAD